MSLLRIPCGKCRAHTLCLCQVGRGKGDCRSGSGRTTHSWHDGLSHAPVWTDMDACRVIRHPGDEDEGAQWACRARQQRGPVERASGPATADLRLGRAWLSASKVEASFYSSPGWRVSSACLTGVCPRMGVSGERTTEESYATLSWNRPPAKFKAERRFRGRCIGSREGVFWF